jgi:type IV pilus assembly protein PilA
MITPMSPQKMSDRTSSDPREGHPEAGFTLIELMVVLLIIAILLAIAIPTFLGVANSAGDRAAQSNLTNALTEAKAIYQNTASYSPNGTALTTATFTASAPEFSWAQGSGTTGGCDATHANCMSEQVVDVGGLIDGQGLILADYSSKTQSCWYALDLETTPVTLASDTGVPFQTSTVAPSGAATAGVFYAEKTPKTSATTVSATTCNANWAATRGTGASAFKWGLNYSNAGAAA